MKRKEAIELLEDLYGAIEDNQGRDYDEAFRMAIEALSDDAVQGEWIKTVAGNGWDEWYVFKCPFCGATIEDRQCRSWEYNFCPNCRADMRGEVK